MAVATLQLFTAIICLLCSFPLPSHTGKRKHVAMPQLTRKRLALAPPVSTAHSIAAYARISKTSAPHDPSVDKGLVVADAVASRKRKATSIAVEIPSRLTRRTISFPPSSDEDEAVQAPPKRGCRRPDSQVLSPAPIRSTPKGKRVAKAAPSRAHSIHKPSESTVIAKSRRQTQSNIDAILRGNKCANKKDQSIDGSLPPHLADLVRLNKAFLKTVALHIAHAGSNVPIDVRTIAPNLSRTWGKRQVTVEDIRRCIAIQAYSATHDTPSTFIISDYGRGKVCVELAPGHNGAAVNEERLNRQFRQNLGAFCAERATDDMADVGVTLEGLSLDDLPKATITDLGAGAKASPMLVKGQRALSELKSCREAKLQDKEVKKQAVVNNPMLNPDGTKMSLLDRLRLKQLAKANEPLAPAGPELQRRAALNRVTDVAATISMLSLSNPLSLPRQAFTMLAMSERLRDSLRVPVSKEEGMACVRLIATEVAPEWLKVVTIGGRENVVVQRTGQPVDRVIQERVQKLMA